MKQERLSFLEELKRRKVVRVLSVYAAVAYAVAEVADLIFPRLGLPDWTITLIIVILLAGLPLVVVLAWAFDVTDSGIVRTRRTASTSAVTGWLSPKANSLVALLIVLGMGAGWIAGRGSSPELPQETFASIGVLPFADMSPSGDMEYFGDGMAEELLNVLAKLPDLKVAGRTSSFSFKGKDADLRSIGAALEVATTLEGSIRRSGNRIRITAQLIRADDQSHLWSDTFDRGFDEDIFDVQEEIARAIVHELQPELTGVQTPQVAAQRGTENAEAYNAYIRGRFQWYRRTREGVLSSVESLQQAIALNPANALARYWYALNLDYTNRKDDAREQLDIALTIDPLALQFRNGLGNHFQFWGETDAAIHAYTESLQIDPAFHNANHWLGLAFIDAGRPEEGLAALAELPDGFTNSTGGQAKSYALLGQREKAIEALSRTSAVLDSDVIYTADAYAVLGLMDEAFGVLQNAINERSYGVLQLVFAPANSPLRADPRFAEMLTAINLQHYWK